MHFSHVADTALGYGQLVGFVPEVSCSLGSWTHACPKEYEFLRSEALWDAILLILPILANMMCMAHARVMGVGHCTNMSCLPDRFNLFIREFTEFMATRASGLEQYHLGTRGT